MAGALLGTILSSVQYISYLLITHNFVNLDL